MKIKASQSDLVRQFYVRDSYRIFQQLARTINFTTQTCIIYKFPSKMFLQEHRHREFGRKHPLMTPEFEPTAF